MSEIDKLTSITTKIKANLNELIFYIKNCPELIDYLFDDAVCHIKNIAEELQMLENKLYRIKKEQVDD